MKKRLIFLCCLFINLSLFSQTKKVLFLGNSYTAVNNLPSLVASIATSKNDTLIYDSNTPGGYTFNAHSVNATTIAKIYSQNWDYVVMQEQSQIPSFSPAQVQSDCYPYADSLNRMIQENDSCTITLFYMTWGRKNGDASNCVSYPPVCTYQGMQARLYQSYLEMGTLNDAQVSPVGAVWRNFRENFPSVDLYQADESHPSIHGSYLAACTFYASTFHKSPVGSSFLPAGISLQEASDIQNTVETVVFDSLNYWRIDTAVVNANFIYSYLGNNQFSFTPDDQGGDEYFWDFGDGNSDITTNPVSVTNTFPGAGTYSVSLIVRRKCEYDTIMQNIIFTPFSVPETEENKLKIYPNPFKDFVTIETSYSAIVSVYDISSKLILQHKITGGITSLDLSLLSKGNYFLQVTSETSTEIFKLSK